MSGRKVRVYEGSIPKSGNKIFEFAGIKLFFRSVKKECFVVHYNTKAVIMSLPSGTEQYVALDYLTKHYNMLLEYDTSPTSYELFMVEHLPKMTKQQLKESNMVTHTISKEKSYSDKGITKKKYNLIRD